METNKHTIRCLNCGHINKPEDMFCENCGFPLDNRVEKSESSPKIPIPDSTGQMKSKVSANEKSRSNNKILAVIFTIVVAVAIVAGSWFVFSKNGENEAEEKTAEQTTLSADSAIQYSHKNSEYMILEASILHENPFNSTDNLGILESGSTTLIIQTASKADSSEVWGQTDLGWIVVSDGDGNKLEEISLSSSNDLSTNTEYETLASMTVYSSPSRLDSTSEKISEGETLKIAEVKKDQFKSLWAKTSENKWLLVSEGEISLLRQIESSSETVETSDSSSTVVVQNPVQSIDSSASETKKSESVSPKTMNIGIFPTTYGSVDGIQDNKMSGPFVVWDIVRYFTGNKLDLSELAATLKTNNGIGTDSSGMAAYLNSYLSGVTYTNLNLDQSTLTDEQISTFINVVKRNVDACKPTIIVVNELQLFGSGYNSIFVTVTGYIDDGYGNIASIKIADDYKGSEYTFTRDEIIQAMRSVNWFTYVY